MVSIFFMKSGLIECIPLEPGDTVNARWYVNVCLPHVFTAVSEWRKKTGLRGLILYDDNAKPHRALITNEFLAENHVQLYPNLPYSRDLSPCDFFLFPKLKNQLRGIEFNDDDMMLNALKQAIGTLTKDDFKNCFNDWFIRMYKCIQANGQYFEKIH
jgi:histone-lysine N-methyltransferase SETMAR